MPRNENDVEDIRKWVGVRLSKEMMHQVALVIGSHPEYAWRTPNDFVRDAVRRHIEHIRRQEMYRQQEILALPSRVEAVVAKTLGDRAAKDFEGRLANATKDIDPLTNPEDYLVAFLTLLSSTYGPTLAKRITERLAKADAEASESNGSGDAI
ncbi:MAG: hypothetical protein AB1665_08070 [Candidatus Thermoplasmatota archaeon]